MIFFSNFYWVTYQHYTCFIKIICVSKFLCSHALCASLGKSGLGRHCGILCEVLSLCEDTPLWGVFYYLSVFLTGTDLFILSLGTSFGHVCFQVGTASPGSSVRMRVYEADRVLRLCLLSVITSLFMPMQLSSCSESQGAHIWGRLSAVRAPRGSCPPLPRHPGLSSFCFLLLWCSE